MLLLVLGVLIWAYSHLMKRVTPGFRAKLGDGPGKGVATLLALLAIYLMYAGYQQAGANPIVVWSPPAFLRHVNNLLMLIAVVLLLMQANRGSLRTYLRHPMLTSVKVWALAHLLVRGDLASIILFGGLMAWAVFDVIKINRMTPAWVRPAKGPVLNDVIYLVACGVALAAISWVHGWILGYPVLG